MIRYALKCSKGHQFESWFQNAEAYDKLRASGMVVCETCGCSSIEKALMAPQVRPARKAAEPTAPATQAEAQQPMAQNSDANASEPMSLSEPNSEIERALSSLRKKIEETSDYVGTNFAEEARAIHLGDAPERSIYGEANADDAKSLLDEGIPVAPLPFRPGRKSN